MTATQILSRANCTFATNDATKESADVVSQQAVKVSKDETGRHPLGVKPSGNALTSSRSLQPAMGDFGRLPDAMILLLFEYLDEQLLDTIGLTCRGLFAYSVYDQFWRDIVTSETSVDFRWRGSWRASRKKLKTSQLPKVDCSYLFSDALYRPFQCSQISFASFVSNIPIRNQISRLPDLSPLEFSESWTDTPFVLTAPVKKWKVFDNWTESTLLSKHASTIFRAEAVDWPLETYLEYMHKTDDENPLYLFDKAFAEKMGLRIGSDGDYNPPDCFGEDLFMLLGEKRPDHRWLIVGPERSGSTFHKDPNATSAWNAVIRGSKYWIMFPNNVEPPGVFMSDDQSEVTSPLSIAEWLLTFHQEARETPGCVEGICVEGEVLHVPSGWWHLVVNLEPAIAITQNFVPKSHLHAALNFLKNKADQVSGFRDDVKDPHALFLDNIEKQHPALFETIRVRSQPKRKWEDVVGNDEEGGSTCKGAFSFGFSDDIEEEENF